MEVISNVLRSGWSRLPTLNETRNTITSAATNCFKNISFSSIKESKWTYIALSGTLLMGCIYKIYKLSTQNATLHKQISQAGIDRQALEDKHQRLEEKHKLSKRNMQTLGTLLRQVNTELTIARRYLIPLLGTHDKATMQELVTLSKKRADELSSALEQKTMECSQLTIQLAQLRIAAPANVSQGNAQNGAEESVAPLTHVDGPRFGSPQKK